MAPDQIAEARRKLGLTQSQFAALLETDKSTIRKMEFPEDAAQHRKPARRMVRLIHAFLDGWRPTDWPDQGDCA